MCSIMPSFFFMNSGDGIQVLMLAKLALCSLSCLVSSIYIYIYSLSNTDISYILYVFIDFISSEDDWNLMVIISFFIYEHFGQNCFFFSQL